MMHVNIMIFGYAAHFCGSLLLVAILIKNSCDSIKKNMNSIIAKSIHVIQRRMRQQIMGYFL